MELIFAILILALAFFGLSIGVIFNNKPLQGTCGGLNQQGECAICGGDPEKCEETAGTQPNTS